MPVHIDKIDTEIEIAPAGTSSAASSVAATGVQASAMQPPSAVSVRDAVLSVLEAELEEYLRMRG